MASAVFLCSDKKPPGENGQKASQSFAAAAAKKYDLFSAATCAWQKTLLTPQTCEMAANGGHFRAMQWGATLSSEKALPFSTG